ncbi:hypothetical protein I4U23_010843 [Adineta vaga]|nr:hypothetical protein I4U23_010843 [Adineta vaga]
MFIFVNILFETYKFRWTTDNGRCAFPGTPYRFPNDTLHPDPMWSTLFGCTILLGTATTPEQAQLRYQGNNSLFVLIGNAGMIWHPLTNQCVLIQEVCVKVGSFNLYEPDTYVKYKTLITSYDCNVSNPNIAYFTYNKNKAQRLSYVHKDNNTGKEEQWCIQNYAGSSIQVVRKCEFDPHLEFQHEEVIFHEVLEHDN